MRFTASFARGAEGVEVYEAWRLGSWEALMFNRELDSLAGVAGARGDLGLG